MLHVFGRMDRGGAELRTLDLLRASRANGVEFHFATLTGLPGSLDADIAALGGTVHPCPLDWRLPMRLRDIVRRVGIDAIHSHVHEFSGAIVAIGALLQVPVRIVHFRSTGDGAPSSPARRMQSTLMRWLIDAFATDILAVGASVMDVAWSPRWRDDVRCRVLHNALDVEAFQPVDASGLQRELGLSPADLVVLHVGSLSAPKNHERLLRMFRAVLDQEPGARLVLAGRGSEARVSELQDLARGLQVERQVTFAGERPDVPRLLQSANVMLFPSTREGFPGAVLEAAAAGLPTVATDLPGVRELAGHFDTIECLSLDEPDSRWAARVIEVANRRRPVAASCRPAAALAATPFDARVAADHYLAILGGSARRTMRDAA